MRLKIISLIILLIFISSCTSSGGFPRYETKCSNQSIWDDRGHYDNFDCEVYYTPKGRVRDCTGNLITLHSDWNLTKEEIHITCMDVCVENCD